MSELAKYSSLSPASFVNGAGRRNGYLLVVELIKKKISEGAPITQNDILETYLDFVFGQRDEVERTVYKNKVWGKHRVGREEYKESSTYSLPKQATHWFKTNLGAAIIAGKLLAIPVIEIDESTLKNIP